MNFNANFKNLFYSKFYRKQVLKFYFSCGNSSFFYSSVLLLDKIFGLGVTTPNLLLFLENIPSMFPQFFKECIQAIALQFIVVKAIEK